MLASIVLTFRPLPQYMRDDKFCTMSGIVNLHPLVKTHWVTFVEKMYFNSYGFAPPVNITKQTNGGNYSEYQIQDNEFFCVQYCLYVFYRTHLIGFENAVLIVFYQKRTKFLKTNWRKSQLIQLASKLYNHVKIIRMSPGHIHQTKKTINKFLIRKKNYQKTDKNSSTTLGV